MSLSASLRAIPPREVLQPKFAPVAVDWQLECTSKPARQALDYWKMICGERAMPRRQALSPFAMRGFLQHVNLVDIVRDGDGRVTDYVMTLEGQHTHEVFGAVARKKLDEALPPHLVQRWRNGFGLVCEVVRPVRFFSSMDVGGKAWLAGEALIAPLGDNDIIEALYVAFASWPVASA